MVNIRVISELDALTSFRVTVSPRADVSIFRWVTPEVVAKAGGIDAMAVRDSRTGESVAGTQGALRRSPGHSRYLRSRTRSTSPTSTWSSPLRLGRPALLAALRPGLPRDAGGQRHSGCAVRRAPLPPPAVVVVCQSPAPPP